MDLARALGFEPGDRAEFCNQVKLFKGDPFRSHSVPERRVLMSLERILSNWSVNNCRNRIYFLSAVINFRY